ncbi:alpha/beta fold hydrolase [Gordonia insulae]|uniref:Alpha/beta hydrolase n=1 Tax=Gordonia insulae TaxID=2420509 RepID=A0A3G8JSQ2_9ACTN|nr:alpha/beta hydrolase [Gordonia insulae]AZG47200.1 hypothetical protein D7316_03808 [Gordonia insulae]
MQFTNETLTGNGVVERDFTVDDIPGVLWMPPTVRESRSLVLMGHGGGLSARHPGVVARAHHYVEHYGLTVAAVNTPGHGGRPWTDEDRGWIDALRAARAAGESIRPVVSEFNQSLAERAVPEWQRVLDELQQVPEIGVEAPVGYAGLTLGTAIGIPFTARDPRISAAVFGGYYDYESLVEAARQITVPIELILSWDDTEIDRVAGLRLFDAFGSPDKTMRAHVGGHKRIPPIEADNTARFFARQLTGVPA